MTTNIPGLSLKGFENFSISFANGNHDVSMGSGNDSLVGTTGNHDMFDGGAGNDYLTGYSAADTLIGGAGNDDLVGGGVMNGGDGNDTYTVTYAGEQVIEGANGGNDTVYSYVSFSLAGQFIETLVLAGNTAINATGNNQANTLVGNSANNVFTTGGGPDIVQEAAGFAKDTITDFTAGSASGHDIVHFAPSVFANYAAVMAHAAQVGTDVVITADAADTLTLQHVTLASLTSADFLFT